MVELNGVEPSVVVDASSGEGDFLFGFGKRGVVAVVVGEAEDSARTEGILVELGVNEGGIEVYALGGEAFVIGQFYLYAGVVVVVKDGFRFFVPYGHGIAASASAAQNLGDGGGTDVERVADVGGVEPEAVGP